MIVFSSVYYIVPKITFKFTLITGKLMTCHCAIGRLFRKHDQQ